MPIKENVISKEQCRISAYAYVYMMMWEGSKNSQETNCLSDAAQNEIRLAAADKNNKIVNWQTKKDLAEKKLARCIIES